jgi:hypothetical protein
MAANVSPGADHYHRDVPRLIGMEEVSSVSRSRCHPQVIQVDAPHSHDNIAPPETTHADGGASLNRVEKSSGTADSKPNSSRLVRERKPLPKFFTATQGVSP